MTSTATFSPYRGLASFGDSERDGLLFFGRERETEILTANLIATRLTVLYGPSGVGKSSLLRAGVARRVRELGARRAIGRGPDLACVVFGSWTGDPVARLRDAMRDAVAPLVSPTALPPPEDGTLADVAEHWSQLLDGDLCIVLDQLEEYFVYHDAGPGSLLAELPDLISRAGLRANVLLAVRDDELARIGELKAGLPGVFANARRLDRLDHDAARAAIVGPVERWNELQGSGDWMDVEPGLVAAVLEQSAAAGGRDEIEAPYLQLVMQRVWDEERAAGSRVLRRATLDELGGAERIVRDNLESSLALLSPDQQDAAARMFEHLVTPSGTKIAHRAEDLAAFARVGTGEGADVLVELGRGRILRALDDDGAGRYEIFHDVLANAVLEWGRRRELAHERDVARRRQRRLAAVVAVSLGAFAVMTAVAIYAVVQRGDAQTSETRARAAALTAGAISALPDQPEHALVLAREAARRDGSARAEETLRTALRLSRARAALRGHGGGVIAVGYAGRQVVTVDGNGVLRRFAPRTSDALSTRRLGRLRAATFAANAPVLAVARRRTVEVQPGFGVRTALPVVAIALSGSGRRVAFATVGGRVTVRDASGVVASFGAGPGVRHLALDERGDVVVSAGGHSVAVWKGSKRRASFLERKTVTGVAVTGDGALAATAVSDGAVRLRETAHGALVNVLVTSTPLTGASFSASGAEIAATDRNGTTRVFDVEDGHLTAVLAGHRDAVRSAAWSADERSLVTGSADGVARIWDPGTAPELQVVGRPRACCTAFAADGGSVVVAAGTAARALDGTVFEHGARLTAVAASGDTVATGSADGTVRLWRRDGTAVRRFDAGARVSALATRDGLVAVGAADGSVGLWRDGRRQGGFRERSRIAALTISRDGRLLATAVGDVALIRELPSGRPRHRLVAHTDAVTGVAFSPTDETLATSSVDHDVRLWDVASGNRSRLLREHFGTVSGVGFSPDGRWLVSAGPRTAGLWALPAGKFVVYLRGPGGTLVGAGFVGRKTVVAAALDGTIRRYLCEICGGRAELLALADRRLAATGARLTEDDRRLYLDR